MPTHVAVNLGVEDGTTEGTVQVALTEDRFTACCTSPDQFEEVWSVARVAEGNARLGPADATCATPSGRSASGSRWCRRRRVLAGSMPVPRTGPDPRTALALSGDDAPAAGSGPIAQTINPSEPHKSAAFHP